MEGYIKRVMADYDQHIADGRARAIADRQAQMLAEMAPNTADDLRKRAMALAKPLAPSPSTP